MARYLERLVARASVNNDAATPRPPSRFDRDSSDPFETTAEWRVNAPAAQATTAVVNAPAPAPEPAITLPMIVHTPVHPEAPQLRVEEHWPEPASVHTIEREAVVQPLVSMERHAVQEAMQPPSAPPILQREIRTETLRTEEILEREVASLQPAAKAGAQREEPRPALDSRNLEQQVLNRLMPALDAWFRSSPESAPEPGTAPVPVVRARPPETESHAPVPEQNPQLVIGSIRVEVASPAAQSPAPAQRIRVVRSAAPRGRSTVSRLGFGLGQM